MPKKILSKKRKPYRKILKKDALVKQSQVVKINIAHPSLEKSEDKKYIPMMPSFNFPQPILQQQQPSGFNLKDVSQLIHSFLPLAISTKDKEIKPVEEIKPEEIKPIEEIPLVNKEIENISSLPESINTSVSAYGGAYERGPYEKYKDITEKYSMAYNVSLDQAYEDIKRMEEEEGKTKKDIQKIINKHITAEDERLRALKLVETQKDKKKGKSKKEEFIELQPEPLFVEVTSGKSRKKK